jgi:hypothetical protein
MDEIKKAFNEWEKEYAKSITTQDDPNEIVRRQNYRAFTAGIQSVSCCGCCDGWSHEGEPCCNNPHSVLFAEPILAEWTCPDFVPRFREDTK